MDDEHTPDEVDARVRAALTPDAATTRRIVMRALAGHAGSMSRPRRWWLVVMAAVALALAVGVSGWQWSRTRQRSPAAPSLAITGRGSFLVVDSQDGRRWVVGPAPERRTGGNYVIVLP